MRFRTTTTLLAAAAALGIGAGGASAATVKLDRACVRAAQPIGFTIAGFAPEEQVRVLLGANFIDGFAVGTDGGFAGMFASPGLGDLPRLSSTLTVTNDYGTTATAQQIVTTLGVTMTPAAARPASRVSFRPFGFVERGTIYAHYALTKSDTVHKLVRTVKLGALKGPCGDGLFKVRQLPLRSPRSGVYEIQFDASKAYHRQQGVYVERTVFVAPKR